MTKAAVSLISLEPAQKDAAPGASSGMLAALIYDSLGDIFSQINDGFQPVHLHRAATGQEVLALAESADTVLLLGEVSEPEHAFQLLLALKLLKDRIGSGQVRVIVNSLFPSKTLLEKLRAHGCTEIVPGLNQPERVVQKARMIVELLLFRRAAARLPGGKVTSIGLAFLLSEWISQQGVDYPSMAHLFSACLGAAIPGSRVELYHKAEGGWQCSATSDSQQAQWAAAVESVSTGASIPAGMRIEWIGEKTGALVCQFSSELTAEQSRLLQAAAELSRDFILPRAFGPASAPLWPNPAAS